MSLTGEGFNSNITDQIYQRQKIYGSINRDNQQLAYLNTRTGWCRLVSGVSIDPQNLDESSTLRNLNLPAGTALAKQFVLWNGTSFKTDWVNEEIPYESFFNMQDPRQGIATDGSTLNNAAYGLGGLDYGIRPMPGIISADIKTETRGSIKRATVRIQANNRQQFDIIDLLYMRLGYSVLLEWGSSSFFTNNGEYESDNYFSLADEFLDDNPKWSYYDPIMDQFVSQDLNYNTMLDAIQYERIQSDGNYDAIFAKVVNFSWTFTKNGTYDITINLISLGDVIESLKANTLLGDSVSTQSSSGNLTPPTTPPPSPIKDLRKFKKAKIT